MEKQYQQNIRLIVNIVVYLVAILLCIFLLPKLLYFFMPFIIGWIISCIANPLVHILDKKLNIKRKAGTVVVIVAVIAAVVAIGYSICILIARQLAGFIAEIPEMWLSLESDFSNVGNWISRTFVTLSPKWTETLNGIGNVVGETLEKFASQMESVSISSVGSVVGNIANIIISIIMCFLSSYFFIADRESTIKFFNKVVPKSIREKWDIFYQSLVQAVGGYIKAQFKIEIWIYFLILFGLCILKIKYAFLIALFIAFLDFLPFFGSGAVFWPWAILRLISGDYVQAIGFVIIWGVGQLVRQLIQPKIMGDSIGLAPLPTLFLIFIGYRIGGVGGMILAIPAGIILINMNEAGFFNTLKYSISTLIKNLNHYRRLRPQDMEEDKK